MSAQQDDDPFDIDADLPRLEPKPAMRKEGGKARATTSHGGRKIELTHDWRFRVPSLEYVCDSLAEAEAAIDEVARREARTAKRRLDLACLTRHQYDDSGSFLPFRLTGIHGGHGALITVPPNLFNSYGEATVFPDLPWIRAASVEASRLKGEADRIEKALERFAVKFSPFKYSDPKTMEAQHAEAAAKLEQDYKRQAARAAKTTLEKEMKTVPPYSPQKLRRIRL